MTYGEKFKEVFGYYPDMMPCPKECPQGRQKYKFCNEGSECEYFADFREKEYEERKVYTNFDKLLQDIVSREKIIDLVSENFCIDANKMIINSHIECENCKFAGNGCEDKIFLWLLEEYIEGGEEK